MYNITFSVLAMSVCFKGNGSYIYLNIIFLYKYPHYAKFNKKRGKTRPKGVLTGYVSHTGG